MQKVPYIWQGGAFVPWDDAKVHVLAHGLHYGSGVFEGIRFYQTPKGPAVFRLKEHVARLFFSANTLKMQVPYTPAQISAVILDLIRRNQISAGYVRPLIYYGYQKLGVNPAGLPVAVVIAAWTWDSYFAQKSVAVKISRCIRIHPKSSVMEAKLCGNYINNILASLEIAGKPYDAVLLLDFKGYIAEGAGQNIFMVKDGTLYTPKSGTILSGITRDTVFHIAKQQGLSVIEKAIWPQALFEADEAFFTGTAVEITPIHAVDDRMIGQRSPGPITQRIQTCFRAIVSGKDTTCLKWLTFVPPSKGLCTD